MSTRLLAIVVGILMTVVVVLSINQVLLRRDIDRLEHRLGAKAERPKPAEQVVARTCELDRQLQDIQARLNAQQGAASTGGFYIAPEWCPQN